jgi:16S rRNA (adenine1518-N6/adenine1519-N6)-dimethyltransferase
LKHRGFRPRKRFGQNFLYDPAIAKKIIAAAGLSPSQTVVELGPGKGILTNPLAELGARLIALEVDRDLYGELSSSLGGRVGVELVNVDFTKVSLAGLLAERGLERCVLMGNIPYHLTRHVLFAFLVDEYEVLQAAYLMVQREVGDRIVSPPGNRVYGITSVILQSLYAVRTVIKVSPGSFTPRPRVASSVLEFKPLDAPLVSGDGLRRYCSLVRSVFQQRRKTLHNSMKAFYSLKASEFKEIQATTAIDLERRPEDLSKEEFVRLSQALDAVTSTG